MRRKDAMNYEERIFVANVIGFIKHGDHMSIQVLNFGGQPWSI